MQQRDGISAHDREAVQYDRQVREYDSYIHDALFGMTFEYTNPHDRLLDIGIGTGLASRSFAKAGLRVYGCDGSTEMLKVCESKAFARELKVWDIQNMPLPYSDGFFDHVISCAVFHFFGGLETIVKEISRIIKPDGILAFSIAAQIPGEEAETGGKFQGYFKTPTPWGVPVFKHSREYITHLLQSHGFDVLKTQKLLIRGGPEADSEDMLFSAYVARKATAEPA